MDLNVEEVINGILSDEALEQPSDESKPENDDMQLPEWYDEKKFNQARRFYWNFCFSLNSSMLMGLLAVLAIPSILKVLVGSHRSTSVYTAYKRYASTLLHTIAWFEHELKPNSVSWRSLHEVRKRHFRAGLTAKLQGDGTVSQRDMALTLFGFCGFALLKPDAFGVRQLERGDWDAYNHFWAVIGHMIGIKDRYNICRSDIEETRQICRVLLDRVYTPCLNNVPEYFEHMARVLLDGLWCIDPTININASLYKCRYLAEVPGYVYTEDDRIKLQQRLAKHLKGSKDVGVESAALISSSAVNGLPSRQAKLLYYHDFDTLESVPFYKRLIFKEKHKLNLNFMIMNLYNTYLGRLYFNVNYLWFLFLLKYLPYVAFFRFGIRASYINIFADDPKDDTKPRPNKDYEKPTKPDPWYLTWLALL